MVLTFRMLVRRFPELAEKVFDACITQKDENVMEFDFQFLDDTYILERVKKDEIARVENYQQLQDKVHPPSPGTGSNKSSGQEGQ